MIVWMEILDKHHFPFPKNPRIKLLRLRISKSIALKFSGYMVYVHIKQVHNYVHMYVTLTHYA